MGSELVTLQSIAEYFGISTSTASRAISGKGRVRDDLRDQIISYASSKGYRKAQMAERERSTTNIINVALPVNLVHQSLFFQEVLEGIIERAAADNYDVALTLQKSYPGEAGSLAHKRCDGIILLQNYRNDEQIQLLKKSGIPFVLVGTVDDDFIVQVDSNKVNAARDMVNYLIGKGQTRIAFIGGPTAYEVNNQRFNGFEWAMEDHFLSVDDSLVFRGVTTDIQIKTAVNALLTRKPDCIVTGDDMLARKILYELMVNGIRVPDDIELVSLYDSYYMESCIPQITAVSVDDKVSGMLATNTLLQMIRGQEYKKRISVPYEIIIRGSTQ